MPRQSSFFEARVVVFVVVVDAYDSVATLKQAHGKI